MKQRLKAQSSNSLHNLLKRSYYYSVSQSGNVTPSLRKQYCQVQLHKGYSRLPQKVKEVGLPARGVFSSTLCSTTSYKGFGVVNWYLEMLKKRPIITKSITSALIYTAADISSQTIRRPSSESFDLWRTLRMAGYGMLILGPSLHFWFNFASRILPKRDLWTTLKKIILGQITFGPVMTCVFFSVNAGLQGESCGEIVARLKRDLFPTLINGVMYWPVCDFITFRFIPVQLQPLVSNGFSYLWTIYMTYMASLQKVEAAAA